MSSPRADTQPDSGRRRARDAALRRTRTLIAAVAAGAVALSAMFSVVAAQAFKGHAPGAATTPQSDDATSRDHQSDATPRAGDDAAPLQPPADPPLPSDTQPSAPVPEPQVSGGS